MKTKISALSEDLIEEIFSRVPLTSLGAVRSTCKQWEALSRNQILGRRRAATARKNQFLGFMFTNFRVCSLRFDLQGIHNEDDLVDPSIKQISVPDHNQDEIDRVYHCDSIFLLSVNDDDRLLVWNPYLGQTRFIQTVNEAYAFDAYALGYDSNRNYKVLRIYNDIDKMQVTEVYDLGSDSWRVIDSHPDDYELFYYVEDSVSFKGNTYFFGEGEAEDVLYCFDFTSERFGPQLPLPFYSVGSSFENNVSLSCVRDEKLAVLHHDFETPETIEIWVSTKAEPSEVSWMIFLELDLSLINGLQVGFSNYTGPMSFFIDEEKKVAVLFDLNSHTHTEPSGNQMVYVVGEDGYFKSVDTGLAMNTKHLWWIRGKLVCSSYVPSLVQLQR